MRRRHPTVPHRLPLAGGILLALLAAALVTLSSAAAATVAQHSTQTAPADTISVTLVTDGLFAPTYVTAPPADRARLFVTQQDGIIRLIKNGVLLPTPYLDARSQVYCCNTDGLLSMAFHPDYAHNGYFYLYYTSETAGRELHVVRYQVSADPDLADPGSATTIITFARALSAEHLGGQLQFGPDGYLYLATGDGGGSGDPYNNAQNTGTLLGKMLRLDVDTALPYAIPPGNPFAGPGDPRDEIWALGLRNPWRFSFDRLNGDLWIGDEGQDSWEEVDHTLSWGAGGENWGWNCYEGTHNYHGNASRPYCSGLTFTWPTYEYAWTLMRRSVTGGYVYRGSPNSPYFGDYFFDDFLASDTLWTLHFNGTAWASTQHSLAPPAGRDVAWVASFGQDATGDLYLADYNGGELFELQLRPACVPGAFTTDVNGDGIHDVVDVQAVAGDFLRGNYMPDYDLDCNGIVDVGDVQRVADDWGM